MAIKGLSAAAAAKRLKEFGPNELKEKKEFRAGKILLAQFASPLIYVLVLAGGVTWFIGDIVDTVVIGAAVAVNTLLGFYQEFKAEKSLQALKQFLTPRAKVIRDGKRQWVDAATIVPGDVCALEVGERVPADGVLLEADNLTFNEAVLTGESLPVAKTVNAEVFMGTTVGSGVGKMRVEHTGAATKFGEIAKSLKATPEMPTPLQLQLARFSRQLTCLVVLICGGIFWLGLSRGDNFRDIFATSVAVAVSAIPEGLVIALTAILALGMQRILKRKALVRQLVAAETLGSVTLIASDKTGTLTEGKMQVVGTLTGDEPLLKKAAILCNNLRDPLETAMDEWARKDSVTVSQCHKIPRLDSIPFDHEKKLIVTLHPGLLLVSGAPEVILSKCQMPNAKCQKIQKQLQTEAMKGQRLVGFAYKKVASKTLKIANSKIENLVWLGAIVFADPLRPGVKEVLNRARQLGIKIRLITGDYRETAEAVGRELGIAPEDIYSRVAPPEKLALVEKWQKEGEVVAMTGDGVNDAPALKRADIGIVVASASAVATETADMVLLDSNFSTILAAVTEGRTIFSNIVKVLFYLMSNAFTEVTLILGSMVLNLPLPLTAAQILWINLVNDSWPTFALIVDSGTLNLKSRELLATKNKIAVGMISLITGLIGLALFYVYRSPALVFTFIAVAPLIYSFSIGAWSNFWLVGAVVVGLILQAIVVYTPALQTVFSTEPLLLTDWILVLALSLPLGVLIKFIRYGDR